MERTVDRVAGMSDELHEGPSESYLGRSRAAAAMTFEQRALAGVSMFDVVAASMRAGIRLQHPDVGDEIVERLLVERLRAARRPA